MAQFMPYMAFFVDVRTNVRVAVFPSQILYLETMATSHLDETLVLRLLKDENDNTNSGVYNVG
jgi:hypothetical protein